MIQKSATVEMSGQNILGVTVHGGPDHHEKAIRHAIVVAGENCEGAEKKEIEDVVRWDAHYGEGDWSVTVVGAVEY